MAGFLAPEIIRRKRDGLALAAAAVSIAESVDPTVRGSRDFIGFQGLPILGTVPEILLESDRLRQRRIWGWVAAGYAVVLGIDIIAIAHAQYQASQMDQVAEISAIGQQQ